MSDITGLTRDCDDAQRAWEERTGTRKETADGATPAENASKTDKKIWTIWADKRQALWLAIRDQEGSTKATIAYIKKKRLIV